MNGKDILGIVLFIILPFAFAGIYLPQLVINFANGRKLGLLSCLSVIFVPAIVVVIFYAGLFFPFAPIVDSSLQYYRFSKYTIPITITPFMINLIIRELIRRSRLKDDIIELERIKIKLDIQLVVALGGLIFVGYDLLSVFWEQGTADLTSVIGIVFFLVVLVFIITIVTSKRHLTRIGMSHWLGTVGWDNFMAYRWGNPEGQKIDLSFHQRLDNVIKITVPVSKRQQIDDYMHNLGHSHLRLPHGRPPLEEATN